MRDPPQSHTERRLAAILAADVAGYSRMMSDDEAGTARALLEHRAAIASIVAGQGGRLVKTTGDGLLIEFSSIVAALRPRFSIAAYLDARFKWKRAEDRARLSNALEQAGLPP